MKFGRRVLAPFFAAAIAAVPFAAQQAYGQGKAPLVKYTIVDEESIPEPLTGTPGDPVKGVKSAIFMPVDQPYMGEVGPSLIGVASRYSAGELRMLIVNPKVINEDTMMPAFYRADGLHRVRKAFVGKTRLNAQQVEDIVAYLLTLKEEEKQ